MFFKLWGSKVIMQAWYKYPHGTLASGTNIHNAKVSVEPTADHKESHLPCYHRATNVLLPMNENCITSNTNFL